jgi:hypothetical protein
MVAGTSYRVMCRNKPSKCRQYHAESIDISILIKGVHQCTVRTYCQLRCRIPAKARAAQCVLRLHLQYQWQAVAPQGNTLTYLSSELLLVPCARNSNGASSFQCAMSSEAPICFFRQGGSATTFMNMPGCKSTFLAWGKAETRQVFKSRRR